MIHCIEGVVIEKGLDMCVLDVGGVGYGALVAPGVCERLPAPGETARLWTYLYVREDQMTLFGFTTRQEREAFVIAITASGVGPRLGQAILGIMSPADLARCVALGDAAQLARVPGIGKKKAEKIILDLKGKFKDFVSVAPPAEGAAEAGFTPATAPQEEAIQALMALGASLNEARDRVAAAVEREGPDATLEALVSGAMRGRK